MIQPAAFTWRSTKQKLFWPICIIGFGVIAAIIIWFISVLMMRTEYKDTALEINDAFLAAGPEGTTVSQGDITLPATQSLIDYYDRFLLENTTIVFNKKPAEPDETSISLQCGDKTLRYTGLEDGTAINVCWITPEGEKYYTVRTQITFNQLNSYWKNYMRNMSRE